MTITPEEYTVTENDRCFAYSKTGQRCEGYAGHDGLHFVNYSWTNEECWTPGAPIDVTLTEYGSPRLTTPLTLVENLVEIPKASGKCVICDHPMHTGTCTRMDGEFDCDCANGVEA